MGGQIDRRKFVTSTAAVGAGLVAMPWVARAAHIGSSASIRVGVIGCGGRGTGAAVNALQADESTRIVAMADLFADRLDGSRSRLRGLDEFAGRVDVPDSRSFAGFDAYQHLLDLNEVDSVILATPPHFRPIHFEAAVGAGKHVFMEKPVAVDPAGVRRVIAASESADAAGLCVVAGTQRRHETSYLSLMEQIRQGRLGEVVSARCYWNQGGLWVHERRPEYSDMEWQCRNWLYFCWLSGDHICEQHIHNLDVINWVAGGPPARATGMGGRQVRTEPKYGNIFDHFAVEYEYPNGLYCLSMCRQIDGCATKVEEVVHGTRGTATSRPGFAVIEGDSDWRFTDQNVNPYVQEHTDLYAAVTSGERLNEGKRVAESTMTAIMGRMSAYTGKSLTWDQMMSSELDLSPPAYEFGELPMRPVPVPGKTKLT